MKKLIASSLVAFGLLLSSCTTFRPVCASGEIGSKRSSSTGVTVLYGLLNFGDSSIIKAAEKAGMTKVSTVDQKNSVYLGGLWTVNTTIISGE